MIAIIGHGGHGKSTLADIIAKEHEISWIDTSLAAFNLFIWKQLKGVYKTKKDCLLDRVNNRQLWFDMISEFCKDDPSALITHIDKYFNMVVGIRSRREFDASKHLFHLVIGVWREGYDLDPTFELDIVKDSDILVQSTSIEALEQFSASRSF